MPLRQLICGVFVLGVLLSACGLPESSSSRSSQLLEVPDHEFVDKLPVGTILKVKERITLLPRSNISGIRGCSGGLTYLRYAASDRERVLMPGLSLVLVRVAEEVDPDQYDRLALTISSSTGSFEAKITTDVVSRWIFLPNDPIITLHKPCKISELKFTFDIIQPASTEITE